MFFDSVLNPKFSVLQNFHDRSSPAAQLSKQEGLKQAKRSAPKGAWKIFAQIERNYTHNAYFEPKLSFIKQIINIWKTKSPSKFLLLNGAPFKCL